MVSMLTTFSLKGLLKAPGLWLASSKAEALSIFERDGADLTATWLGRRVTVRTWSYWKKDLTDREIIQIYTRIMLSSMGVGAAFRLCEELAHHRISLQNHRKSDFKFYVHYRAAKVLSNPLKEIAKRSFTFLKLSLQTVVFYFGLSPKYMFSARSLWDMENRYQSLERLITALCTLILSLYQARIFTSKVVTCLGLQGAWGPQLALMVLAVAVSMMAISMFFYGLRKLFHMRPLEIGGGGKNMSYLARSGAIKPLVQPEEKMAKLSQVLCRQRGSITWLRGAAGLGKTRLIEEFARRVACDLLPQELGNPEIFYIECARLNGSAVVTSMDKVSMLQDEIEGFEKDIIMVFDECHLLEKAVIEAIKTWQERGLRIILISNAQDEKLKESWGEDTFNSLVSHTLHSFIKFENPTEEFLKSMVCRELSAFNHLRLEPEAIDLLVLSFKEKEGASRALSQKVQEIVSQAKLEQLHSRERIDLANKIVSFKTELQLAILEGRWDLKDQLIASIEDLETRKKALEDKATKVAAYHRVLDFENNRLSKILEISSCYAASLKSQAALHYNFLATLTEVAKNLQSHIAKKRSQYQFFPFVWKKQDVEKILIQPL